MFEFRTELDQPAALLIAAISYGLPYHGLSGLQVGFLVAFTQLIPEHQLQLFGALKLRVKVSMKPSPVLLIRADISLVDSPRNLPSPLQCPGPPLRFLTIHACPIRFLRRMGLLAIFQS